MSDAATPGFYQVRLVQQRTGSESVWTAEHPQLLGCHVVEKDPQAAIDGLGRARDEWLARAAKLGLRTPTPDPFLKYVLILAPDHTVTEAQSAGEAVQTAGEVVPSYSMPGLTFQS